MFGFEYVLALVKGLFNVAFAIVSAIPAYYAWNCIAPVYLGFITEIYKALPYWHIVAFFLVCTFLGEQVGKLTPKFVSVSQTNEKASAEV